jgi:predicted DNA-binding transcriptional regulator AlpA
MQDRILDYKEVCRRTSLTEMTLHRMTLAGSFPAKRKIVGRRVGWSEKEVQAWIDAKLHGGDNG